MRRIVPFILLLIIFLSSSGSSRSNELNKEAWKSQVEDIDYKHTEKLPEKVKSNRSLDIKSPTIPYLKQIVIGFSILILCFLLFLLIRTMNKVKAEPVRDLQVIVNEIDEDIAAPELDSLLVQALKENNFRIAIRIYFIITIQKLNSAGWIEWQKNKTNRDYFREMDQESILTPFKRLTGFYELCWYGKHEIGPVGFESLQKEFLSFIEMIPATEHAKK